MASINKPVENRVKIQVNCSGVNDLNFSMAQNVLSKYFMDLHNVQKNNEVAIVQGKDFNPRKFGYRKIVANSDDFVMYFVKKGQSLKL